MIKTKTEQNYSKIIILLSKFIFKTTSSFFIYTWKPINKKLLKGYKKVGFLQNPFSKGWFSHKVPLIIYSEYPNVGEINPFDINSFDLQPMMQD